MLENISKANKRKISEQARKKIYYKTHYLFFISLLILFKLISFHRLHLCHQGPLKMGNGKRGWNKQFHMCFLMDTYITLANIKSR